MDFSFHAVSCLFFLALVGTHASPLPAEDYWQSVWPNTPMPKALWNLIQPKSKTTHAKISSNKIDVDVYNEAESKISVPRRLKDKVYLADFFLEQDLHPGTKMNLQSFTKRSDEITFLPHKVAKSMPFSSNKLTEILNHFGVETKSEEAERLKYTLQVCENPAINGESKFCAKSLESLTDFSVSKLGKNIKVISTEVDKEIQKQQQFIILDGVKKVGDKAVVCHKLSYPYAVFYCHEVHATRAYSVPLVAADGTKVNALAVCHSDTAPWSNKNMAFEALKVKPGTVPVCHFLATDTLLWFPN